MTIDNMTAQKNRKKQMYKDYVITLGKSNYKQMTLDKMTLDKMTVDKMSRRRQNVFIFIFVFF